MRNNNECVSFAIWKGGNLCDPKNIIYLSYNFWATNLRTALNETLYALCTFRRLFNSSDIYNARSSLDLLHWVPVVSLSWRMRRESLAQVTALLKTMKQTLYERGYGANYLAISRASNKWASLRTSLFLSSLLTPPFSALLVFSAHLLRSFLRRGPTSFSPR